MSILRLLFSALFLNKNSMLDLKTVLVRKKKKKRKKCHWSQSILATCAAVDEHIFSDNKCIHWKIHPQFWTKSINLFLLWVPRAARRLSNTQDVASKMTATLSSQPRWDLWTAAICPCATWAWVLPCCYSWLAPLMSLHRGHYTSETPLEPAS